MDKGWHPYHYTSPTQSVSVVCTDPVTKMVMVCLPNEAAYQSVWVSNIGQRLDTPLSVRLGHRDGFSDASELVEAREFG